MSLSRARVGYSNFILKLILTILTVSLLPRSNAQGYTECQTCVHCAQDMNKEWFGSCSKNSMNTAIVDACEYALGCTASQTKTKREWLEIPENVAVPAYFGYPQVGASVLFQDGRDPITLDNENIADFIAELGELVLSNETIPTIVNWTGIKPKVSDAVTLEKRITQAQALDKCNLLSASKHAGWKSVSSTMKGVCVGIGQTLAAETCKALVKEYWQAAGGKCTATIPKDEL